MLTVSEVDRPHPVPFARSGPNGVATLEQEKLGFCRFSAPVFAPGDELLACREQPIVQVHELDIAYGCGHPTHTELRCLKPAGRAEQSA